MKKLLVLTYLIVFSLQVAGQPAFKDDSLRLILQDTTTYNQKIIKLLDKSVELQPLDLQTATLYTAKALELAENADDSLFRVRTHLHMGYNLNIQGKFDSAVVHFLRADSIAQLLDAPEIRSDVLNTIGGAYLTKGLLDEALKNCLEALRIAEEHGMAKNALKPLSNLGSIYTVLGDLPKALAHYQKVIKIATDQKLFSSLANSLYKTGNSFFQFKVYDSAIVYLNKALELQNLYHYDRDKGFTLTLLASVYKAIGQTDLASSCFYQAIPIIKQGINNYGYISIAAFSHLGELFQEFDQLDSAIIYHQKGLNQSRELAFLESEKHFLEELSSLYAKVGNFEKAYELQKEYIATRDTLMNREKSQQISDLQIKYETEQKEKQIALQNVQLQRQKSNTRLILIGSLAVLLLILLAFQRYRIKQRINILEAQKIKELDRIKSNFFANISHEFRTPLTLIIGSLSKLMNNQHLSQKELTQDYRIMQSNSKRLLQLINQILELARLDQGKSRLHVRPIDLLAFIRSLYGSFSSYAAQKKIRLLFNGQDFQSSSAGMELMVYLDQDKMEKVFYNLFSNAIKFTPENGEIEVRVILDKSASRVEVSVRNTGPGIPANKLPFIFDRFFQAESESTRKHEGTGIGLSLVKELVELHYGTVSVESRENDYTEFKVSLLLGHTHFKASEVDDTEHIRKNPVNLKAETDAEPDPEQEMVQPAPTEHTERVLIVEDHPELSRYIGEVLATSYQVQFAENGKIGLQMAVDEIPDLVISDVMMPEMDGFEMLQALKSNDKTSHIPVILLTAKAAVEDKLEGLGFGADDYLIKPFLPEELKVRVANLIRIRKQLREKFTTQMLLKPQSVVLPSSQELFMKKVMSILEEKMSDERFGLEEFCQEIGMSRAQTHRKIKAITNLSPGELIRNFRLEKAADLIRQEVGNMAEIAYQVGFSSQAYFTKCFQEYFKCTPTEYKKNLKVES